MDLGGRYLTERELQKAGFKQIGAHVQVHTRASIYGAENIRLGDHVRIDDFAVIVAGGPLTIGSYVSIHNFCFLVGARVAEGASIGPFAHLRPDTEVGRQAKIGNFVELKKTSLGAGSKANHLSYLGNASIGPNVNVGAGTITCNYDGERKHQTVIEEGAFIGSDTQLIAPVTVGKGAYIAAGSSITEDVPAGSLGIARGRQTNVEGWVERRKNPSSSRQPKKRSANAEPETRT